MTNKIKVIAVVGPTASGKSEMAVKLAKRFHGQVISADSRQVYKGMDIGSGKVEPLVNGKYKGIPHWAIDIVSPKAQYSVSKFQSYGKKKIQEINNNKQIPIICGGTGQWIDSLIYGHIIPKVKPNVKLRLELEKKSVGELFVQLQNLDPDRAKTIDSKNPRRLIRALEIVLATGKPVPQVNQNSKYDCLWIGVVPLLEKEGSGEVLKLIDLSKLHQNIDKRLKQRLSSGIIDEVKKLHASGVSWKHLEEFGLEYKYCALYLQNKLELSEMKKLLAIAIKQYAKRQLTWFKRNKNIHWVETEAKALQLTRDFLKHA